MFRESYSGTGGDSQHPEEGAKDLTRVRFVLECVLWTASSGTECSRTLNTIPK